MLFTVTSCWRQTKRSNLFIRNLNTCPSRSKENTQTVFCLSHFQKKKVSGVAKKNWNRNFKIIKKERICLKNSKKNFVGQFWCEEWFYLKKNQRSFLNISITPFIVLRLLISYAREISNSHSNGRNILAE